MKFLYLWPLFLLLLVPIVIIMYLMKQKAVKHPVPSIMLWKEMYNNIEANTPWEKLKKNWLMILQIITLIILILALMSPLIFSKSAGASHCVIVIDNSGSMGIAYNQNETRLDYAKKQASEYVKNLKAGTTISLISSASSAVLCVSSSDNPDQVLEKIEEIPITYSVGDATSGIEMVKSMKSQWESLETVCFTDSQVDLTGLDGYVVDVYSEVENLSVDYVSHGENSDSLVVLAKVSNHGGEPVTRDVSLYGEEGIISVQTITIPAGESEIVYYDKITPVGTKIWVEVSGTDDFMTDNVAYDVLDEKQVTDVLLMTEANVYLEKAMELIPGLNVTKSSDIESFNDFGKYDLYIFDNMIPYTMPKEGNFIIFNCPCDSLYEAGNELCEDGYLKTVESCESTVTEYLDVMSFSVSSVHELKTPLWAEPFFKVKITDEENKVWEKTVAFSGQKDGQRITVIGFDLHNSNLPLMMEFPMLMFNILNESVSTGLLDVFSISSGEEININGKLNETLPVVTKPDGEEKELSDYRITYTDTNELGIYQVSQLIEGETVTGYFSVNFPSSESYVKNTPSSATEDTGTGVRTSVAGIINLRNIVILIALLLLGVEWVAYLKK